MLQNQPGKENDYDPNRVTNEHVSAALFLQGVLAISPELFREAREDLKKHVGDRMITISRLDEQVRKADEISKNTDWENF